MTVTTTGSCKCCAASPCSICCEGYPPMPQLVLTFTTECTCLSGVVVTLNQGYAPEAFWITGTISGTTPGWTGIALTGGDCKALPGVSVGPYVHAFVYCTGEVGQWWLYEYCDSNSVQTTEPGENAFITGFELGTCSTGIQCDPLVIVYQQSESTPNRENSCCYAVTDFSFTVTT